MQSRTSCPKLTSALSFPAFLSPARPARSTCSTVSVSRSVFQLHWSDDEWTTKHDTASTPTSIGIEYADIQVASTQSTPIRFTFYWPQQSQWQGEDFEVAISK